MLLPEHSTRKIIDNQTIIQVLAKLTGFSIQEVDSYNQVHNNIITTCCNFFSKSNTLNRPS
jgi:hypothetical protein